MKNIIVLYHKNCMDGMAAAWVCYKKYGNDAEYIACDDWKNLPSYVLALSDDDLSKIEIYFFQKYQGMIIYHQK